MSGLKVKINLYKFFLSKFFIYCLGLAFFEVFKRYNFGFGASDEKMAEWTKAADCKSVKETFRRFESYSFQCLNV
jgi:hypothetical protein